jgi:hypothetical protein
MPDNLPKFDFAAVVRNAAMLPITAARPDPAISELVPTVTNLQQNVTLSEHRASGMGAGAVRIERRGLPKSWAKAGAFS